MTKSLKLLIIPLLVIIGSLVYLFWQRPSLPENELPVIAITQVIEHHTLDTVRAGLMAELASAGFDDKTVRIVYENAHGSITTAAQIANKFAALHPKIMGGFVNTISANTVFPFRNHSTPLVFSAVTNPVAAKLVLSETQTGGLITGVSDFMSPRPQLDMILSFLPNLKKLGVLHNPAEINSASFLDRNGGHCQRTRD